MGMNAFGPILKGAAGSAGLKATNLLLGLAATAFLGRVLQPQQYGFYTFASTTVTLLALPVQCGLPQLLTREIARYQLTERWDLMRGILMRANQLVAVLGLAVCVALALLLPGFARAAEAVDPSTFVWAIVLLPLIALNRIRGAALIGLRKVVLGMLPDNLVRALLFVVFLLAWYVVLPLDAAAAMAMQVAATFIAFVVGALLLMRHLPRPIRTATAGFETRSWIAAIIPLTMTDALMIFNLQADILLLGFLRSAPEVGLYRAASLVALQVTIGLSIAGDVLAPHFARRHHADDREGLQALVSRSLKWLALSGLVLAGGCMLAGETILTGVFGPAYAGGAVALAVLAAGQFVNTASGPGAVLLNMTGCERDVTRVFLVSAALNVTANLILIPRYGIVGAASATAATQLVTNAALMLVVRRRLGVVFYRGFFRLLGGSVRPKA